MMILASAVSGAYLPQGRLASSHLSTPRRASAPMAVATEPALEQLRFLKPELAEAVVAAHGSPAFVYDEAHLKAQAATALAFPNAYGLTVRFAMKSLPNAAVLGIFDRM